jgi:hypothetical protein
LLVIFDGVNHLVIPLLLMVWVLVWYCVLVAVIISSLVGGSCLLLCWFAVLWQSAGEKEKATDQGSNGMD